MGVCISTLSGYYWKRWACNLMTFFYEDRSGCSLFLKRPSLSAGVVVGGE